MPETPVLPKPNEIFEGGSKNGLPTPDMVFGKPQGLNPNTLLAQDTTPTTDQILEGVKTNNDNEKELLKNLAIKVNEGKASHQDLTDAILTVQGQHPYQEGHRGYSVMEEDGVFKPKPLKQYELPKSKAISTFSEKSLPVELQDSWNRGLEKLASGLVRTPGFLTDLAMSGDAGWAMDAKLGLGTASEQLSENLGLPKENRVADYIEKDLDVRQKEFQQTYDKGITDYWSKGERGKAISLLANSIVESAPTTLAIAASGGAGATGTAITLGGGAVFGAQKKAELDKEAPDMDETTKLGISTLNGLAEGFFEQWGITKVGGMIKDVFVKEGKDAAQKFAAEAFTKVYAPVLGKYAGAVAEEGVGEAATQFAQNAIDKFSGYKPDLDLKEGVMDALIVGVGAAGGPAYLGAKAEKSSEKQRVDQSAYLYDEAKKGTDAAVAFKADMENGVSSGRVSPIRAKEAIQEFNAYRAYHEQTQGLDLSEDKKKEIFGLSYQKEQLEASLGDDVVEKDLSPPLLAIRNAKQKQAKDLQKQIDEIVLREDVQKQPVTADKAEHDIVKGDEKQSGVKDILSRYGGLKSVKAEGEAINPTENKGETKPKKEVKSIDVRPYEEIPFADWNQKRASEKFKILSNHLAEQNTTQVGVITKPGLGNDTVHIELPNNKHVIFASSATSQRTGNRGHLRTEVLPEEFVGHKVVIKPIKLTTGKTVLPVYSSENGKHVGYVREDDKGASQYTEPEIEQLQHLITDKLTKQELEAYKAQPLAVKPSIKVKPAQSQDEYVKEQIDALSQDESADFNEELLPVYEKRFKELYDEQQRSTEGATPTPEELTAGDVTEIDGESTTGGKKAKTKALRTGTKRANQKIKDPARIKALEIESTNPYDLALQYFIKNGHVNRDSLSRLFRNSQKELNKRFQLQHRGAPTVNDIAHLLWEGNQEQEKYDSQDYTNAVEEALLNFHSRTDMANDINERWKNPNTQEEEIMMRMYGTAEKQDIEEEVDEIVDKVEELGNNDITDIAENPDNKLDDEGDDIIGDDGAEPVFQKQSSVKGDFTKVFEHIKKVFPKINVVLDETIVDKEGNAIAGKISADGKTLSVNPNYAGLDSPIHEGGHVLIDAIGYNNSIVQLAIKQLKGTPLWKEIAQAYPITETYTEEMLGKEVLAEAIGREGAGIFDKVSEQSKFKQYLSYIYDWFKSKLGINKNVAKSLAKQIIGGIGTKELTGTQGEEQLQKPKKKPKTLEEKSPEELKRSKTLNLDQYRESLGRDLEDERKTLIAINEYLESDTISDEDKQSLTNIRENLKKREKADMKKWYDYKEDVDYIYSSIGDENIRDLSTDKLIELYNTIANYQDLAKLPVLNNVMKNIAYRMFQERKGELKEYGKFIESRANKQDLKPREIMNKVLGHMAQTFPELQKFSGMFEEANFDMQTERYGLKNELESAGKGVIKELNKKQGVPKSALGLFSSSNAKYFEFVEHPDGRYYTVEEGKAKGFSPAQIKFLEVMLKLNELRNAQLEAQGVQEQNNDVLKVDMGVKESFAKEGLVQAFSYYLGDGFNLSNVRIEFTDPVTKKVSEESFGDIEKKIIEYGKSGKISKAKGLGLMLKYNFAAKRQLKTGTNIDDERNPLITKEGSEYSLNTNGQLTSKFNKQRDKGRGYSKDFYKAAFDFIDDYTHVKHMAPLIPYIESIQHLNDMGFEEHGQKPNVVKWIKEWKDAHIFKREKPGKYGPEVDATLRFLRKFTSMNVMAFALRAAKWNLITGIYNTWKNENSADVVKGKLRLLSPTKGIDPKANAILKWGNIISTDYHSNPKLYVGRLFANLAHAGSRAGEYYIQGSQFFGIMSDEDWNSFEFKDGKLTIKEGVDEKALKKRIIAYGKRVSDIQGKYSDKDRRNILNTEWGKTAWQFKVWMPDWWKERFGDEYYTADNVVHRGSWREFTGDAVKDLYADIKAKGPKAIWNNKRAMSNLKGAMVVAATLAIRFGDDDDEKKRRRGDDLDQALGNLLFIFDPEQLEFMVKNPFAIQGTLTKFVTILKDALHNEEYKGHSKYGEKGDSKVPGDIAKATPYRKIIEPIIFDEEE